MLINKGSVKGAWGKWVDSILKSGERAKLRERLQDGADVLSGLIQSCLPQPSYVIRVYMRAYVILLPVLSLILLSSLHLNATFDKLEPSAYLRHDN